MSTNTKLSVSQQFSKTYSVISGGGWRKDVVNKCMEFDPASLSNSFLVSDMEEAVCAIQASWGTSVGHEQSVPPVIMNKTKSRN